MAGIADAKSKQILRRLRSAIQRWTGDGGDPVLATHLHVRRHNSRQVQMGRYILEKGPWGTFWILDAQDHSVIHGDLYSFHAAIAIIEHLNCGQTHKIPRILELEEAYTRKVNELKHIESVMSTCDERRLALEHRRTLLCDIIRDLDRKLKARRILKIDK